MIGEKKVKYDERNEVMRRDRPREKRRTEE